MSHNIYTGILKAFPMPTAEKKEVNFIYDNDNPQFIQLKSDYPIESAAGNGNDFSKAVNLLHWVSNHIYHNNTDGGTAHNSLDLLNYSYDKGHSLGVNCICLSTILSECFLSVGLKAKTVYLMPCSPYDGDNHAVTTVFIKELNKWVMFDPSFNAYFSNEQGVPLSLLELRDCLANQSPIFFSDGAKYNDDILTEESKEDKIEYFFEKNLFYFRMYEKSTFGTSNMSDNRLIILCPQGYDPKHTRVSGIEYVIKKYYDKNDSKIQSWLERVKQEKYIYCSTIDFEEKD